MSSPAGDRGPTTETVSLVDRRRRSWAAPLEPRPVRGRIWHPDGPSGPEGPAPLVLLSHGDGAAAGDLDWLARPLATAGFRVGSVDHHGNSWVDGYLAEGFTRMWERPDDLRLLTDHISAHHETPWVGVGGFSAGGYTAAALLGARVDPDVVAAILRGDVHVDDPREFPGLFETVRATTAPDELPAILARAGEDLTDPRARAGFLVCPGAGRILTSASIEAIRAPVAVVTASSDTVTPEPDIVELYVARLPHVDHRSVGPYDHADFFPSSDRTADVRAGVAAWAVAHFRRHSNPDGS